MNPATLCSYLGETSMDVKSLSSGKAPSTTDGSRDQVNGWLQPQIRISRQDMPFSGSL
ncbi:MAG: hypothetical protein HN526_15055 [Gammaproteobacteria bacterium]|nr:hypothetical protein [Gammaproteobacteria bacterium]